MARASTIAVTGFPLFVNLYKELRMKIWHDTLPDAIKPALFQYKHGCWHLLHLTKYDPCEFRHSMLGHVQIKTRLVSVNHEAREIAVEWAHKKGFVVQKIEGYPIFSSPFNPGRDILYIPPNKQFKFWTETDDILDKAPRVNRNTLRRTFVQNFATMEYTLVLNDPPNLCRIFKDFLPVRMLVILIETKLGTEFADRYLNLQKRWEIRTGGAWVWDNQKNLWDKHGREFRGKLGLYSLVDEVRGELQDELTCDDGANFKIQVAAAIPFRHRKSSY
ncbi:uncharacterized protein EAE98_006053 [Botrytis deweyae]|uniref:2EXR domain-containing protein n=1 Tax=Botrytis deweyae TaxID=2478750 RepID=A0ABQ7ILK2_9HELO|nr:uncharacterized protein EAE98_006053 [Botrytis deweyae]KAF7927671.1 hypothetical protein EAE98_006053 [Botrytis deweyae]